MCSPACWRPCWLRAQSPSPPAAPPASCWARPATGPPWRRRNGAGPPRRSNQSVTTVTAPRELAGLTAVRAGDTLSVRSGDTLLPAGASTDVCPANCLPYLLDALSGGYLTEQNEETLEGTPCLRLSLDTVAPSGAPVQCAVWLDKATLIPLYGEFSQNGQVVLTVKMLSFTCRTEG